MKNRMKRGCLIILGILCLIFLVRLNQVEKETLYETEGQTYERAQVIEVLQDNVTESGNEIGNQRVLLELKSGKYKGTTLEATSSSSYLFGAHCQKGMNVIAIVSVGESGMSADVFGIDRGLAIVGMVFLFILAVCLIGGKKGIASIVGLFLALGGIIFVFLPLIYRGISPILAAVFMIAVTTTVTMYLLNGISAKTITAIGGTIGGVIISGTYAWIFGKVTHISGYNVSDIENLIYISENTEIKIGELLFAGILIASLGAVMDVGMSIASTQQEILDRTPELTPGELFSSGMNVGKDMMGTMSNTLILAFAGGSLNTLVYFYAYNYSGLQLLNMYSLGIEIMQGISATMGVVMTVPITAAAGAVFLTRSRKMNRNHK